MLHCCCKKHRQTALRMSAEVDFRNTVQFFCKVYNGQCICQPLIQRMLFETAVALSVTVHIHPECGAAYSIEHL